MPSMASNSARLSNRIAIIWPGLADAAPDNTAETDCARAAPTAIETGAVETPQEFVAENANVVNAETASVSEPFAASPDGPGEIDTVSASFVLHCRVTFPGLSS